MSRARLRPVRFGSCRCSEREQHFHSFVGEAITGWWAIGQNKKYISGAHFYWMCDCSSLKELFDYSGDIHQICRIAQELLGYNFTFVHRPARMMRDVDSLNRVYDPLIGQYEIGVADRANADRAARPSPYNAANFPAFALKCPNTTHAALHTPTSVTLSAVTPHVQHDQTQHLTTNYPITWSRMTSTNPSTTLLLQS